MYIFVTLQVDHREVSWHTYIYIYILLNTFKDKRHVFSQRDVFFIPKSYRQHIHARSKTEMLNSHESSFVDG